MKYLASTVDSIFTPMVSTTHHNLLPGLDPRMVSSVVCTVRREWLWWRVELWSMEVSPLPSSWTLRRLRIVNTRLDLVCSRVERPSEIEVQVYDT